jgi:hypothetical protein
MGPKAHFRRISTASRIDVNLIQIRQFLTPIKTPQMLQLGEAPIKGDFTMRISTVAIVAVFAIAVSGPALAQKSQKRTAYGPIVGMFGQCESRAFELGMVHGQAGHAEYVRECMGTRPGNANIAARYSR